VAIQSVPSVLSFVKSGKLTAVAVTTPKRSPLLPDTPTLTEAGIKGVEATLWVGVFAPVGTPPAIVAKLNSEVNKVLQMPSVKEKIQAGGAMVVERTSADFASFVQKDYAKWGEVVKASGVKLE
jgi:tripartite-type tricarboxylate transporter receptor subunit TctC